MRNSSFWLIWMFLIPPVLAFGEDPDTLQAGSLSSFELMPILNPWLMSTNPAGHRFDPDIYPGRIDLNYNSEEGLFKRVQEGDQLRQFSFQTERYKKIDKTSFYGNFSYDKSYEKGCNYNNVNDPFRGTPYLLIDTIGNNDIIDREFFTLRGDISTPLLRNLTWGFSADMNAGLSSQNRDPRPKNKVLNLSLSQGLLFTMPHVSLGINGLYSYYNEDIEVDIIEKNVQMAFLQLHGFDTYTYHVAASFNRLYKRNTAGGEGQLQVKVGKLNSLISGKFLYINETADDGRKAGDASWSYIKNDSKLEGNEMELLNTTTLRTSHTIHSLNSAYKLRYMVGAEFLQRLEQVGEAGAVDWVDYGEEEKYSSRIDEIQLIYTFLWMNNSYSRNFQIDLGIAYQGSEQAYYLPDMHQQYKNRILSAGITKIFRRGRHEILTGTDIKVQKSLEFYRDFDVTSFIGANILLPDFMYLTGEYIAPGIDFSYSLNMNRIFSKYFIHTGMTWYRIGVVYPGSDNLNRTIFNLSTGVIF